MKITIGRIYEWEKGQRVVRTMAGIESPGTIVEVKDSLAYFRPDDPVCKDWPLVALWSFDDCGYEYDEEMEWGFKFGRCVSYILPVEASDEQERGREAKGKENSA